MNSLISQKVFIIDDLPAGYSFVPSHAAQGASIVDQAGRVIVAVDEEHGINDIPELLTKFSQAYWMDLEKRYPLVMTVGTLHIGNLLRSKAGIKEEEIYWDESASILTKLDFGQRIALFEDFWHTTCEVPFVELERRLAAVAPYKITSKGQQYIEGAEEREQYEVGTEEDVARELNDPEWVATGWKMPQEILHCYNLGEAWSIEEFASHYENTRDIKLDVTQVSRAFAVLLEKGYLEKTGKVSAEAVPHVPTQFSVVLNEEQIKESSIEDFWVAVGQVLADIAVEGEPDVLVVQFPDQPPEEVLIDSETGVNEVLQMVGDYVDSVVEEQSQTLFHKTRKQPAEAMLKKLAPEWVKEHDIWEEAKKKVKEQYGSVEDNYAIVTDVYKSMGGHVAVKSLLDIEQEPLNVGDSIIIVDHPQHCMAFGKVLAAGGEGTIEVELFSGECLDLATTAVRKLSGVAFEWRKRAQDEPAEEIPTALKEVKIKPKKLDISETELATPKMAETLNDIRKHKNNLDQIAAVVQQTRARLQQEIAEVERKGGKAKEAEALQQSIERLSRLLEDSEGALATFGDTIAYLNTEPKKVSFRSTDKWKVEKLLDRFGQEAEEYLEKALKGAKSLDQETQRRELTLFPKKSGEEKRASIFETVSDLIGNLWDYVQNVSSIHEGVTEVVQLELPLTY